MKISPCQENRFLHGLFFCGAHRVFRRMQGFDEGYFMYVEGRRHHPEGAKLRQGVFHALHARISCMAPQPEQKPEAVCPANIFHAALLAQMGLPPALKGLAPRRLGRCVFKLCKCVGGT